MKPKFTILAFTIAILSIVLMYFGLTANGQVLVFDPPLPDPDIIEYTTDKTKEDIGNMICFEFELNGTTVEECNNLFPENSTKEEDDAFILQIIEYKRAEVSTTTTPTVLRELIGQKVIIE